MARKQKNVVEPVAEVGPTKEELEKMMAELDLKQRAKADAIEAAKKVQDELDAAAVEAEAAAPQVKVTCEVCGQEALLTAGTDVKNPAKALAAAGMSLPMLGTCAGKPTGCLLERARAAT